MPLAHNAVLRAHCHATEEEDRVVRALATLAGEAPVPTRELAEGHYKNAIIVLEVSLLKSQADKFWARLRSSSEVAERLAAEAERRVDDTAVFYARFDKQRAFEGTIALTAGDDAIHLRSKLAAFPSKKPKAVSLLRAFLGAAPPQP